MAEYSRLAKGHFTSTGLAQQVVLPFVPDYVELINYTAAAAMTDDVVPFGWWDASMGQGFAVIERSNGTALLSDIITSNGFSTFSAGLSLQFGPVYQHTGSTDFSISKASPAVVTTTTNHNLQTGDVVVFSNLNQTATTGMFQIAGVPFMITRTGATTFTINYDTSGSNFTAFNTATSTGNIGSYKQVLYPFLYFPGWNVITAITTGTTTTISTAWQHQYKVGQTVGFRIPNVWGTTQLNELPNVLIPGQPIYGYVVSVTDTQNFVVSLNSVGYTAFVPNQPFAGTPGRSFAQVLAIGDVNTGGDPISAGSALYPSPAYSYATLNDSRTINGPAILGAFVNNTRQGFIVGAGASVGDADAHLVGAASDVIYWRAYLDDYVAN